MKKGYTEEQRFYLKTENEASEPEKATMTKYQHAWVLYWERYTKSHYTSYVYRPSGLDRSTDLC